MNIDCLQVWIEPLASPCIAVLGPWEDGKGYEELSFLSLNFEGGPAPGPASQTSILDIWYASPQSYRKKSDGRLMAHREAQRIQAIFEDLPAIRPFSNVRVIAGIIGPKLAEGGRYVYKMTVEITS